MALRSLTMLDKVPSPSTHILVFPQELWELVGTFLAEDGLAKLLLVGNRLLSHRIRYISTVTVHWMSSAFCDWQSCKPFLSSFPRLNTLTLSTQDVNRLIVDEACLEILPTSLTSLTLRFPDVSCCFEGSNAKNLHRFPSLTYLHASEISNARHIRIMLDDFPPTLLHLYLHLPDQSIKNKAGLGEIFPNLLTLDVGIGSCKFFAPTPPHLTHLGIGRAWHSQSHIDITTMAKTLQFLRLYGGELIYEGQPLIRHQAQGKGGHANAPALRSVLPHLHTLILPSSNEYDWRIFEALPLSVTRIGAKFGALDDVETTCEKMNQLHCTTEGPNRPGAPMMIRRLDCPPPNISALLPFFPLLEDLKAGPKHVGTFRTDQLPRRLISINVRALIGPIAHLPSSLSSLICQELDNVDLRPFQALSSSYSVAFPFLTTLIVSNFPLFSDHIHALPNTLETLEVLFTDARPMEALAEKTNVKHQLSLLTFLSVEFRNNSILYPTPPQYDTGRTEILPLIDNTLLPASLTHLELSGDYLLAASPSTQSLAQHRRIKTLTLHRVEYPATLLSQIPNQVLHLTVNFSVPIDLNDNTMVQLLLGLPHNLRSFHINGATEWFTPAKRASLFSWPRAPQNSAEWRFELLRRLPGMCGSESELLSHSEEFTASCLPRTLSTFSATYPLSSGPGSTTNKHGRMRFARPLINKALLLFFTLRLPLLGIFKPPAPPYTMMPLTLNQESHRPLISALPLKLSSFQPGIVVLQESFQARLNDVLYNRQEYQDKHQSRYWNNMAYHCLNILVWTMAAFHFRPSFGSPPFIFQWVNMIGSALTIPVQSFIYRQYLTRKRIGIGAASSTWNRISSIFFTIAFLAVGLVVMSYASFTGMIAFGYGRPGTTLHQRLAGTAAMAIGECVIALYMDDFV